MQQLSISRITQIRCFYRFIVNLRFASAASFAPAIPSCIRYPAVPVCKKCAKMCRAKISPLKQVLSFYAKLGNRPGSSLKRQLRYYLFRPRIKCTSTTMIHGRDMDNRTDTTLYKRSFPMNKLLSCRYNMDTNRVEARFADGCRCHRLHRRGGRVRQHPRTAGRAGLAAVQQAAGVRSACAGRRDGALSLAGMRPRQAGRLSPYKEHGAHRPMVCHKLVASLLIHKQLALFG